MSSYKKPLDFNISSPLLLLFFTINTCLKVLILFWLKLCFKWFWFYISLLVEHELSWTWQDKSPLPLQGQWWGSFKVEGQTLDPVNAYQPKRLLWKQPSSKACPLLVVPNDVLDLLQEFQPILLRQSSNIVW